MSDRLKKLYLEKSLFFMGIISMPSMYYLDFERLSNLPHIAFMPLMQSIIWISIFPFNFIQSTIVSSVPFLTSLTLLVNYDSISFTLYIFLYFFPHILLVSNKWKSEKESRSNFLKAKTIEEKCDMLMNTEGQIVKELIGIKHLLDHQPKEMYHIVEYNDLCDDPKKTIEGIYDFLGIYRFNHRYTNLDQFNVNGMKYDDNIVGQNLHTIETNSINSNNYNEFKENVNDILPKSIIEKYNNLNFWKGK